MRLKSWVKIPSLLLLLCSPRSNRISFQDILRLALFLWQPKFSLVSSFNRFFSFLLAKDVSSILSSFEANLKKEFNLDVIKLSSDSAGKFNSRNQSVIQ